MHCSSGQKKKKKKGLSAVPQHFHDLISVDSVFNMVRSFSSMLSSVK